MHVPINRQLSISTDFMEHDGRHQKQWGYLQLSACQGAPIIPVQHAPVYHFRNLAESDNDDGKLSVS